jgi:RNA polymerase sigma-70 factor (ECF subfamily)
MDCPASTLQSPERLSTAAHHGDEGDRDLLRRIRCADRRAFEQLYLGYHKRLVKFLFRVIRRHEDLEEVINDAFLIVWQHAGDFRGASRVSTWIFGIAYRCALKAIRRSTVRLRGAALDDQDGEAAVEDAARETEDRQLLDLGISCLPPEQRLVFVLAYCMDHSCEEIAAIVACPVNTVKSRMWHARRKLRTIISAAAEPQRIALDGDGARARTEGLALL